LFGVVPTSQRKLHPPDAVALLDFQSESFFFCFFAGPEPGDVYTSDVCRSADVLPFVALVFIDLFDYMTLRSASVVSIKNVRAVTSFLLSIFKGMNTSIAPLPYIYVKYIMG
jgi:hypothetical protein